MATVTGFKCLDETGMPILCDAYGNNAALRCLGCGSPILITFLKNQKGSDPVHPSKPVLPVVSNSGSKSMKTKINLSYIKSNKAIGASKLVYRRIWTR